MNPWPYPVSQPSIHVPPPIVSPTAWGSGLPTIAPPCSHSLVSPSLNPVLSVSPIQTAIVVAPPNFSYALPYPVLYPTGVPPSGLISVIAPAGVSPQNPSVQAFKSGGLASSAACPPHQHQGTSGVKSGNRGMISAVKPDSAEKSDCLDKFDKLSSKPVSSSMKTKENRTHEADKNLSDKETSCRKDGSSRRKQKEKSSKNHHEKLNLDYREIMSVSPIKRLHDPAVVREPKRDQSHSRSRHKDKKSEKHSRQRSQSVHRKHRVHKKHRKREKSGSRERSPMRKTHQEYSKPYREERFKSPSKYDKEKHKKGRIDLCAFRAKSKSSKSKYDLDEDSDIELVLPKDERSSKSPLSIKFCVKDEISDSESFSDSSYQAAKKWSNKSYPSKKALSSSRDEPENLFFFDNVPSYHEMPCQKSLFENNLKRTKKYSPDKTVREERHSPARKRKKSESHSRSRRSSSSPETLSQFTHSSKKKMKYGSSLTSSRNSLIKHTSHRRERSRERKWHISHARHRSKSPVLPSLSTEAYKDVKSFPAENYYQPVGEDSCHVTATEQLKALHTEFQFELVDRAERVRATKPKYEPPKRKTKLRKLKPPKEDSDDSSSSCCDDTSSDEEDTAMEELERKRQHPDRLHLELWFNDPKEMNDGPLCRCSAKARRAGIRHGIYVGEDHLPLCDPLSNNASRLHHYRVTMTPVTNFLTENPTKIHHDGHDYLFEGFSMFSHSPLPKLPNCKVIRFNYEYTVLYIEEPMPKNFTVQGLELFSSYLLNEILELVDLNWKAHDDPDGCPRFHFMPRFTRELKEGGKELLPHSYVLEYLLQRNEILIDSSDLSKVLNYHNRDWQKLADKVKGMIITCPGKKPSSIRVDQLDREQCDDDETYPVIVHFGVRPPQLSYAGNPSYQKAWREYVKYRHLLANKPKVKYADRHKLLLKETRLQEMRMENDLKRDVTVVISSKGFYKTGIMSDVIQHAMLLPVLVCHLRFHQSLTFLEQKINYSFEDRYLLQLALTHPSYRENFGTNPDHARNSLTNCGLRQPQYGDRRIHYMNTRKRGINTLINIMSRFGSQKETISCINHNERLEFLGDAVVEFLSSIHLFYMFPDLEEGGLATYRAAIVQNQHLAVLSKKLELDKFMLYAHGSDLCHDLELRHAMANCFEALMGALFLDNGIEIADKVFSETLFTELELLEVWINFSPHPLQEQEPEGDRKWIASVPLLQKLNKFEEMIGIEFNHIRLLARALTHRSLGYNNLTLGSNQRLEFLGDTVLQLVASEYLYKFFPEHHEGHLSLLRSSLVNNRTQAVVCVDLGMVDFAIYPYSKVELKPKDKADLLEAFLGALYVDKDLSYCRKFCEVCFFPRLQDFIMNQDWNDPKSKLQQCCLTLRSMDGGEPDIPTYKVIECKGPTNTRVYSVAVYFQRKRLAVGSGHSIQQAEMDAAANALMKSKDLFPQLKHQRRAIERSLKHGIHKKEKKSSKH